MLTWLMPQQNPTLRREKAIKLYTVPPVLEELTFESPKPSVSKTTRKRKASDHLMRCSSAEP